MYDSVALAFAIFPAMMFWGVIFGAPAALWIVFRKWRAPGSIVPRTRIRFYLAALIRGRGNRGDGGADLGDRRAAAPGRGRR